MAHTVPRQYLVLIGLLFLLFMAPFDEGAGRDLVPLTAVTVTAIVLATAFVRRLLGRSSPAEVVRSPALLPLLLFLAVAAASVGWSIDRFVSLTGVARILACTMVFLLVLGEFREAGFARTLCAGLVFLACALCPLGIVQGLLGRGAFPTDAGARAHAVFVTPNTFAGFLIIVLPMAVSFAVTARGRLQRYGAWCAAALCLSALILSQSRGAWVAGAVGLTFLGWQLARLKLLRLRLRPALAAGALIALVLASIAVLSSRPDIRRRVLTTLRPHKAASLGDRFVYWRSALEMAAQSWPLGIGLDTYHIDYPAHRHPSQAGTDQWYAHNDFLQTLVELGPLGLAALLWLLWKIARMARAALSKMSRPGEAAMVAACCAGAGAGLLHSMVDYNLYVPATAFPIFLCFGIIAAAYSRLAQPGPVIVAPTRPDGTWRRVLSASVLAAGTAAAMFAVRPLVAQQLLDRNPASAPVAVAVCPASANYWASLGHVQGFADLRAALWPLWAMRRPGPRGMQPFLDRQAARTAYENAVRLSPRTAMNHAFLGRLLLKNDTPTAGSAESNPGLQCFRRACALDRYSQRVRWFIAQACLEAGLVDEARRHLRFCLEHCRPEPGLRRAIDALLRQITKPKGEAWNRTSDADREPNTVLHLDRADHHHNPA